MKKLAIEKKVKIFRSLNIFLTTILALLCIYILIGPFIPALTLHLRRVNDKTAGFKYESNLAKKEQEEKNIQIDENKLKPRPTENTLVIPKIGVDTIIYEGETAATLDKGIWRRPQTSTPDKGGNTVLTSHRYTYVTGPNTFYSLDKIEKGDKFVVFWKGIEYDYEVFNTKVIEPTEVSIENNTKEPIITLYTCTPLWTAKQRLVVQGKLIAKS